MHSILILLSAHRAMVLSFIALACWVGAYAFYFRSMIRSWFHQGAPHNWSVDLVNKQTSRNGRIEV